MFKEHLSAPEQHQPFVINQNPAEQAVAPLSLDLNIEDTFRKSMGMYPLSTPYEENPSVNTEDHNKNFESRLKEADKFAKFLFPSTFIDGLPKRFNYQVYGNSTHRKMVTHINVEDPLSPTKTIFSVAVECYWEDGKRGWISKEDNRTTPIINGEKRNILRNLFQWKKNNYDVEYLPEGATFQQTQDRVREIIIKLSETD